MAKYVLSPEAQSSLKEIRDYTRGEFGQKQAVVYLRKLRERMRYLAENPCLGMKRNDIKKGYFSYFEGSHTIYYKIQIDSIDIIDVLHQAMEPERHL